MGWLEQRGVLTVIDGDTETFVSGGGDALYDVDGDAAGRLLLSPPSVLAGLTTPDDFLTEPSAPTPEAAQARTRHHVHRRLLTEAVVYYDDLPEDEREYARQRRNRIREELERLTGGTLECRAEGQALVGLPAADPFPAGGAVAQAALLLGGELVAHGRAGAALDEGETDAAWRRVVAAYGSRFTTEYRADPERLRADATVLLERLGLVREADAGTVVRPAMARYRPEVRLPETLDV